MIKEWVCSDEVAVQENQKERGERGWGKGRQLSPRPLSSTTAVLCGRSFGPFARLTGAIKQITYACIAFARS